MQLPEDAVDTLGDGGGDRHYAVVVAGVWIGACILLRLTIPHIVFPSVFWSTVVATIVFMALSLGMVYSATRIETRVGAELVALGILVAGFLLFDAIGADAASELCLVLGGIAFGKILSRLLRDANMILPVAVVAGIVDIWGVNLGGPVAQMVEKTPQLFHKMTAQIPSFSTGVAGSPKYIALIGVGDFAFLALFFASLSRFGLNAVRASWLSGLTLCTGMLLVTLAPVGIALPGLPFMVVGILLANRGRFRYTREEKVALAYGGAALILLLGLASLGMHNMR
ncbi:MAG: hypothetical protein AUJ92_08875 [Armatimonadetes bacterium CG2_30_59_28]|nr:MAG: hypothetical protein AUJ92_08875 [Armatimonadetes bacterium CG2_30_59_28]PIU64380.1 MAG: hypothetical protein COS85_12715 [Armatimonadetes bacterium CG07_land_8_20_14_0_80_59_28]PIX43159.1 MAG: hypothetical protein COZ56_07865 [Armatimonadetes bacterium CG_4_8_14_3_um_filter_58_9]PIY39090.1 MAG: hypothetical protein COZ05_19725 [Armatimonadetes bacterium CG_4_10_14_3_um_filter_59_10]PJB72493.1 MAG: hypothetical protein CO095_06830 [Armatimonadetes bacterium CG_4_9_14_3_um_filter_58_7]